MRTKLPLALPLLLLAAPPPALGQGTTSQLSTPRFRPAATALGAQAFFASGEADWPATLDVYDASQASWSTLPLTTIRGGHAATTVDQLVMIAGGGVGGSTLDLVEILDVPNGTLAIEHLSEARFNLAATTAGGVALFAGGSVGGGVASARVDLYDAASGQWRIESLSEPRTSLAATSVGDVALFAGGWGPLFEPPKDRVDLFDAAIGSWSVATLSEGRAVLAAASVGNKALFAGGFTAGGASAAVDIYDASTGTWSVATLSQARHSLAACTVGDKAFFGGGFTIGPPAGTSDVVDVYDAATGTWSVTTLAAPRFGLSASSAGGLALFAGGRDLSIGVEYDLVDLIPEEPVLVPYCAGDGSGAPCPCSNPGAGGEGCANSTGAGATLTTTGWVSVSADDLALFAAQLVPFEAALAFVGREAVAGGQGAPFGDGLRCAETDVVRLGIEAADFIGEASFGPGLGALGGWSAGDVRYFQVWYRDPTGTPCGSGFNLSPGVEARFFP